MIKKEMNKAHIMVLDQVVRCKNCKYNKGEVNSKGFYICSANGMDITDDDFCSWGERNEVYHETK